jgi:glutaredoxin 2
MVDSKPQTSEILNPESKGGLGYDDIDLFGRLRSLTIIKGLDLPTKVNPPTLSTMTHHYQWP